MNNRQSTTECTNRYQSNWLFSGVAGVLELGIFHPLDTVVKRIQKSSQRTWQPGNSFVETVKQTTQAANAIVFDYKKGLMQRIKSLYQGAGPAGLYKVVLRTYKFGTQPVLCGMLHDGCGQQTKNWMGDRGGNIMLQSISGGMIGATEVIMLPIDTIKVKMQTGQKDILNIIKTERFNLYNGSSAAMVANALGSSVFFGVSAFVRELYGVSNPREAGFVINLVSATMGAIPAVLVSNAADVIRTRAQSTNGRVSSYSIFQKTIEQEGYRALAKGSLVRMFTATPKFAFTMTMSAYLPQLWLKAMTGVQCDPTTTENQVKMKR